MTNGGFVQLGWDAKSNGQSWAWWGESDPGAPNGEDLHDMFQISTGWHSFKIQRIESGTYTGYWDLYIDSTWEARTNLVHPYGTPAFDGETSNTCTEMYGWAQRNPSPPYTTLWYSTPSGWASWLGDNRGANSVYYSDSSGGTGTDLAWGG